MADERAFDVRTPPLRVTNPGVQGNERTYREYPRHLYRADGMHASVTNDFEKQQKLAGGWCLTKEAALAGFVPVTEGELITIPINPPIVQPRRGRPTKAEAVA